MVGAVVASWPAEPWPQFAVTEGEQGPRVDDWGRARVVEPRDRRPGPEAWLLGVPIGTHSDVAATRFVAEPCCKEAKGETGRAQEEVRHGPSWYRHLTRSLLAPAGLAAIRRQAETQQKGAVL